MSEKIFVYEQNVYFWRIETVNRKYFKICVE